MYRSKLNEKLQESLAAVLPILAIVLILSFTIAPLPTSVLMAFLFGAVLLVVGMMFFSLGAELAMSPMGERVGACITKTRRVGIMLTLGFLLGFLITQYTDISLAGLQIRSYLHGNYRSHRCNAGILDPCTQDIAQLTLDFSIDTSIFNTVLSHCCSFYLRSVSTILYAST